MGFYVNRCSSASGYFGNKTEEKTSKKREKCNGSKWNAKNQSLTRWRQIHQQSILISSSTSLFSFTPRYCKICQAIHTLCVVLCSHAQFYCSSAVAVLSLAAEIVNTIAIQNKPIEFCQVSYWMLLNWSICSRLPQSVRSTFIDCSRENALGNISSIASIDIWSDILMSQFLNCAMASRHIKGKQTFSFDQQRSNWFVFVGSMFEMFMSIQKDLSSLSVNLRKWISTIESTYIKV